jgi:hypothetical protein
LREWKAFYCHFGALIAGIVMAKTHNREIKTSEETRRQYQNQRAIINVK